MDDQAPSKLREIECRDGRKRRAIRAAFKLNHVGNVDNERH